MKNKTKLIIIASLVLMIGISSLFEEKKPAPTVSTTTSSTSYNIPMKNGKYETVRENDLEELCKDYIFYRDGIIRANQEGDIDKVRKYQASFQQVNAWLNQYNESDVQRTFSRLGSR